MMESNQARTGVGVNGISTPLVDLSGDADDQFYEIRETVGLFGNAADFERAVEALESAGFDRAGISVLGTREAARERIGGHYESMAAIADSKEARHAAYVSSDSLREGEAAAIGVPFYVVGLASAAAVAASGGSLAFAIAATIAGGGLAAGIGAVLARAISRAHSDWVRDQLDRGGIVLWVATPDDRSCERARSVLERCGASGVHRHRIDCQWGPASRPLFDVQPDPLLGKGL